MKNIIHYNLHALVDLISGLAPVNIFKELGILHLALEALIDNIVYDS